MKRRLGGVMGRWVGLLLLGLASGRANGNVILVSTNDNYAKIEAANPGDEVVIAPGTYAFRLYLTKPAAPTNPIWIHAQFPANPPVWDFGSTLVENAPGSYTAGDRGRGGWQFSGARNYTISGIVIRHCRTASNNSAGIRYYNGTTNLVIRDCVFEQNDNGLTGGTQNSQATVEFCEFKANGNLSAGSSAPTHNLYIYNDVGVANLTLSVRALYNTFIGVNTNAAFVHVSNSDSNHSPPAILSAQKVADSRFIQG